MAIPSIRKRPVEQFSVGLTYVSPDLEAGETITNVTTSIDPDEPNGIKPEGPPTIDAATVSQIISGGENGKEYKVKFQVTTSAGHLFEDAIFVLVRDIP